MQKPTITAKFCTVCCSYKLPYMLICITAQLFPKINFTLVNLTKMTWSTVSKFLSVISFLFKTSLKLSTSKIS